MGHGHGHGHGHGDFDLEAELASELPTPYCMGNWRQWVGGLVVSSIAVAAIVAVSDHPGNTAVPAWGPSAASAMDAQAGSMSDQPGQGGGASPDAVTQVAFRTAERAERRPMVDPNVRQVAAQPSAQRLSGRPNALRAFNQAAHSIRPSVVGIRTQIPARPGSVRPVERLGSGVIVDPRGLVITCDHVVRNGSGITVSRFRRSQERIAARVVATSGDLALLQMADPGPHPAAPLGDSNQLSVGDWVLAVGHPFGLGLTVTAGIVGRTNGTVNVARGQRFDGLIQTDAPINEGSSGGPLVDLEGRIVGINTAIYAPTGVFSGTGFAIGSNEARRLVARATGQNG